MTIGERIRAFREQRGMTQKQLGKACGMVEATIRKYELGTRKPKPEQLKRIADGLQISDSNFYDFEITRANDIAAILFILDSSLEIELSKNNNDVFVVFKDEFLQKFMNEWYEVKKKTTEIKAEIDNVKTEEAKTAIMERAESYYNRFKVLTTSISEKIIE
ncbi:MAG: helix-turn-helix transcriptional regulator [Firmicutes bacterium]|nr:helix-turn-helix transcriptional regulator [Bacillota bacterium]